MDNQSETYHRHAPFSMPVVITFYDRKQETVAAKFYVRNGTPYSAVEPLVAAVANLSLCVMKSYRFDGTTYSNDQAEEQLKTISPYATEFSRWWISYHAWRPYQKDYVARGFSIPGRDPRLSLPHSKEPDLRHPKWVRLFELLAQTSVSEEGYAPAPASLTATYQNLDSTSRSSKKRR
jgi:hypothetical protein